MERLVSEILALRSVGAIHQHVLTYLVPGDYVPPEEFDMEEYDSSDEDGDDENSSSENSN